MTRAGEADQRITFQRFAKTADGIGGLVQAWANVPQTPTVWAKVTPRLGGESMENGRVAATSVATFTVRYREDVAETDRILWRGEPWNIRRVMRRSERGQWLDIDAERGVAQ